MVPYLPLVPGSGLGFPVDLEGTRDGGQVSSVIRCVSWGETNRRACRADGKTGGRNGGKNDGSDNGRNCGRWSSTCQVVRSSQEWTSVANSL